ncbi:unnamed protein product [Paramecium octaurelia]|uniref:Uncharacterized protein n=1 Tax=Paramecium octaurelia TaxID=43137 RepID=A0A8S1Y958_PAROT|nr:unnamed protein product [Paramecium octaurelia]
MCMTQSLVQESLTKITPAYLQAVSANPLQALGLGIHLSPAVLITHFKLQQVQQPFQVTPPFKLTRCAFSHLISIQTGLVASVQSSHQHFNGVIVLTYSISQLSSSFLPPQVAGRSIQPASSLSTTHPDLQPVHPALVVQVVAEAVRQDQSTQFFPINPHFPPPFLI